MPNENGRLTASEKTIIQKRIDSLWVGSAKNCPICGSNQWFIADHIVESPIVTGGVRGFGATAYPAVMLISQKCGYTIYFNAVILDVVKRPTGGLLGGEI